MTIKCEGCGKPLGTLGEQDYCTICSKNLCDACMDKGCDEGVGSHKAWSKEGDDFEED